MVSQDIQLYFDSINHLLKFKDRSQNLLNDLKESNIEINNFANSLNGGKEEMKE